MIQCKALITAEIGKTGYRQFPVTNVQSFAVDTALDTDADPFSIDLSNAEDLTFFLDRDSEVRASIFTSDSHGQIEHLHTGIADIVSFDSTDMILSIAGRDMSCIATDSQAPPGETKWLRPQVFVTKEAQQLGYSSIQLASGHQLPKFYRDGSETYWESWYRIYRKMKMWLWTEPDGRLIADKLNYSEGPQFYFGRPHKSAPQNANWIPVESVTITSNKQQRIGEQWVFGERGDVGFLVKAQDPSIRSWKRKNTKIMTSTKAKNKADAREEAWEEVFESKVGAMEIVIRTPLTRTTSIKQNHMAMVNVPGMGLTGVFFVVGIQKAGGPEGYYQDIRLREKNFAISRRVPDDPKLTETTTTTHTVPGNTGGSLRGQGIRWANSFASAAMEFHGSWDLATFLGILLSICQVESQFRNVRGVVKGAINDVEWFPSDAISQFRESIISNLDDWHRAFANAQNNQLNPRYPSSECAVGPMQLVTPGYKVWADEYAGVSGEYDGGRWLPQANIRAGARAFVAKLVGLDPTKPSEIWIGVERYYGSKSQAANDAYRVKVKREFDTKYGAIASAAISSGGSLTPGDTTDVTVTDANGNAFTVKVPDAAPSAVKGAINFALRQLGKPYEWGAEGPASYDCSGICFAAYGSQGVKLARDIYGMYAQKDLEPVNKSELQSGDLIFFFNLDHMGMYLNDGYFIQAPHTGDVVKISPLNSPSYRDGYVGARRVISWLASGTQRGN